MEGRTDLARNRDEEIFRGWTEYIPHARTDPREWCLHLLLFCFVWSVPGRGRPWSELVTSAEGRVPGSVRSPGKVRPLKEN